MRHLRSVLGGVRRIQNMDEAELMTDAKNLGAPYDLVLEIARTGKLPVPNFSAGGVATPADAALMMHLGAEAVFVGSGIFKSGDPAERAKRMVDAVTYHNDFEKLVGISANLGVPMVGIDIRMLPETELLANRGW